MTLWLFLTICAVVGMLTGLAGMVTHHKRQMKQMELESQQARAQAEVDKTLKLEVEELKKRIEVLETIVTDNKYQLNQKISSLD